LGWWGLLVQIWQTQIFIREVVLASQHQQLQLKPVPAWWVKATAILQKNCRSF